jgi:hypothetical protein
MNLELNIRFQVLHRVQYHQRVVCFNAGDELRRGYGTNILWGLADIASRIEIGR